MYKMIGNNNIDLTCIRSIFLSQLKRTNRIAFYGSVVALVSLFVQRCPRTWGCLIA